MVHSRALAGLLRVCEAGLDARALRAQALQEIRRGVDFDGYAWLLTDPATWVGAAPLAEVSWLSELPRHIRLKYGTAPGRWTGLGETHVATLPTAPDGDPAQSLPWREFLLEQAVGDVASVVFPDQHGCWGFLELFRDLRKGPFTASETALLVDAVAPLTTALRRTQAGCFLTTPRHDRGQAGPAVVLLSPELEVLGQTSETDGYLRALVPPADRQSPIPAGAYNVAAQLLAVEAGVDRNPATARVHVTDGEWVTLRAARIESSEPLARQNIAVTIEASSPAERLDLFARCFALSARETELLEHLASGSDTKALASQLFLSPHTVQDHLKSIFAKTGTRTRLALLSRALGTS